MYVYKDKGAYIFFVPLDNLEHILDIPSTKVLNPLYTLLFDGINADVFLVISKSRMTCTYRQVLEQNIASSAGFLLRKMVFKQAYPGKCCETSLVSYEPVHLPRRPRNVVFFLSTSGITYTGSGLGARLRFFFGG